RELAIDLERTRLTPVQAAVGIMVLSRLQELGVDPAEIEGLSALFRTLNTEGTDMPSFTRIALSLEEVRKRTGLSVEELEVKVHGLEESASRLEPLVNELKQTESVLKGLERKRKRLVEEVAILEKRHQILKENVRDKEQREIELSNRLMGLEDRTQNADERLTITRKDLEMLSCLGISQDNLSAFSQRLKVIAQRHSMKPEVICSKLMGELEQLEEGFGLEVITKAKKQELRRIEATLLKTKEESAAISITNERLRQEQSELKAILSEERRHITDNIEAISTSALTTLAEMGAVMSGERRHITKSIKAINTTAENTGTELKAILLEQRKHITKDINNIITAAGRTIAEQNQNLRSGVNESVSEVNRLRNHALQLGKELEQFNELIESNKWLKSFQALVKGDEKIEPDQVRVIGTIVMQALLTWLDRHSQDSGATWLLRPSIVTLISGFEKWNV
ncbi:hypothetical protein ACFLWZ_06680, partial [Chloroflexota bacterium]